MFLAAMAVNISLRYMAARVVGVMVVQSFSSEICIWYLWLIKVDLNGENVLWRDGDIGLFAPRLHGGEC